MSSDLRESRAGQTDAERSELLADQTCVVTGASRGIGRRIATEFAGHGADVVVNYHSSPDAAESVADAIETAGGTATAVQADVADFEATAAFADRVRDEFGAVDVLVNNAGVNVDKRFERLTPEDWQRVVDVNLGGAFNCTKAFYDDLKEAEHGRVVNISSVVGQQGNFGQVNYAASKSGLFGFTKSLALELAPHGTTANCVAPGFTATDMADSIPEHVHDRICERIPLNRFASVDEIVPVVRFLASEESSYVTGEIVNVNGGMHG
ncbi:3-oxoacyl-ACP reductase family protein [Halobacterium litoreum]|uniref:3-oxoacyl-ACP reductase family protein n=1 Tax=Halobacterium litoreum TaxID=2039234 RepID=A0ABD5NBJ0_9EURY|nr:3-oxoacyl-ACP reductase family protein [Halobacterium litoreum]UHH14548.1 3-oxoacyl-ACP reductase FabG [Halobacterium litoreum]